MNSYTKEDWTKIFTQEKNQWSAAGWKWTGPRGHAMSFIPKAFSEHYELHGINYEIEIAELEFRLFWCRVIHERPFSRIYFEFRYAKDPDNTDQTQ